MTANPIYVSPTIPHVNHPELSSPKYAVSALLSVPANSTKTRRESYCNWLSLCPFEWFITLTFKYEDTTEQAGRDKLRKLVRRTERELFGKHRAGRTIHHKLSMVVFEERNLSDGLHYHCLVQPPTLLGCLNTSAEYPLVIRSQWIAVGGGFQFDSKPIATKRDIIGFVGYGTKDMFMNTDCVNLTWFQQRTG